MGFNLIFPVFFIIILAYILKKINIIDDSFIATSTKFVFYIVLPIKLFFDIKNSESRGFDFKYVIYLLLVILIAFLLSWAIGRVFIRENSKLSAFVHCSFRSNFVFIGIPVIEAIMGNLPMDSVIAAMIFGPTLYNILATFILTSIPIIYPKLWVGYGKYPSDGYQIFKLMKVNETS